jgi:23S rRNA G2069 N7-methylase RlmK/C1962 C5-methylase RlmI
MFSANAGPILAPAFSIPIPKIRVRLISRNANDKFDEAFFERRLRYAYGNTANRFWQKKICPAAA